MPSTATPILDSQGVARVAAAFASSLPPDYGKGAGATPKFVLLSSAAVTRPSWTSSEQEKYADAFNIPIVSLNPMGILDQKAEGEAALRASGAPYAIVRPCALNDDIGEGRLVLSSGDVATGRISRADVAELLVAVLSDSNSLGKTFEALTVEGLPKVPLSEALGQLPADSPEGPPKPSFATYSLLQQLSPASSFPTAEET